MRGAMADYLIERNESDNLDEGDLDKHIGERVKTRRIALGISQNKLGIHLGVTFQQIQKYEKGINRISASTLYRIAGALSVDYSYFFEGFGSHILKEENVPAYEYDSSKKKETTELLKAYYKISSPAVRKKLLELIKSFANVDANKDLIGEGNQSKVQE